MKFQGNTASPSVFGKEATRLAELIRIGSYIANQAAANTMMRVAEKMGKKVEIQVKF